MMPSGLAILGARHSIEIILMLHDKPGMNKTEIARSSSSGERSRSDRVDELVKAGILEEYPGEHWSAKCYKLSEFGKDIAEHLVQIRDIFDRHSE